MTVDPVVLGQRLESAPLTATPSGSPKINPQVLRDRLRRRSYRPSAKATILGLLAIIVLLGANVGVVWYLLHQPSKTSDGNGNAKVINNQGQLDSLGVNHGLTPLSGIDLVVNPGTRFKQNVIIDKQLQLSGKLIAAGASLTDLQAGDTSLTKLNVNNATTLTDLSLRGNLLSNGTVHFVGPVTLDKLVTAAALNVTGDLNVGGTINASNFSARSLTSNSTLTIGGHIITRGNVPSSSSGPGVGSNGSSSISGNDTAGTVQINTGQSPSADTLITVRFSVPFSATPHVIVTPIGRAAGAMGFYVDRNGNGFSIGASNVPGSGISAGFDYQVMQ